MSTGNTAFSISGKAVLSICTGGHELEAVLSAGLWGRHGAASALLFWCLLFHSCLKKYVLDGQLALSACLEATSASVWVDTRPTRRVCALQLEVLFGSVCAPFSPSLRPKQTDTVESQSSSDTADSLPDSVACP